ncbi:hypothetical protein [Mycolicibacterium elephantis]|nr:hypothetical protein [Mycolicibacterium elephantis]
MAEGEAMRVVRAGFSATAGIMLALAMIAGAPAAGADSVDPGASNYGSFDIFTEPGTYVVVNASNFTLMSDNTRPEMSSCNTGAWLQPKGPMTSAKLAIDAAGNGQARIGPLGNGTYTVSVHCYDRRADGSIIGTPSQPSAAFADRATVVIDGSPMHPYGQIEFNPEPLPEFNPGPLPPLPPAFVDIDSNFANNVGSSCSDGIKATYERNNIGGGVLDNALALLGKRGTEETAHQICALVEDDPEEAVRALCRAGKAVLPADWAYAAIAKFGQTIGQNDIERFGQSAKDSWSKQCEGFLF